MTSRVYGASEDKLLAQLERNLDEARADGAPWRVLAALVVGTAVPLAELAGEFEDVELVEVRAFGDAEPRYIESRRPRPIGGTVPRYLTDTDGEDDERAFVEFWDNDAKLMREGQVEL